jgi:uncharacterized protein YegJ (DUF2314 family)
VSHLLSRPSRKLALIAVLGTLGCAEPASDLARSPEAVATRSPAPVHSVSADGDTAFTIDSDDPEMAAARRLARCTVAEFTRRFLSPPAAQTALSLKGTFRDGSETEYLWVDVFKAEGDTLFRGTVANDPGAVRHVTYGDTVTLRRADVADWFAVESDTLVAGFTMRVYRNRLTPVERVRADSARGYAVIEGFDAHRRLMRRCS